MVSPYQGVTTYAKDNINGFLSSILAWLPGPKAISGGRKFEGFEVYSLNALRNVRVPDTCKTALSSKVLCDDLVASFQAPSNHGTLANATLTDSVCDAGCQQSLANWFLNVDESCSGFNISSQLPTVLGGRMWAGVNETCLKDSETGEYCNGTCILQLDNLKCGVCGSAY